MKPIELWHGDCLELMKSIPDGTVDLVLTDPPYGTTACKWDSVISRVMKQRNGRRRTASNPYKVVTLWDNGKQFDVEVHRLVANAFLPNPKNLPCVNHKDGDPSNNDVSNLEWCSYSDNVRHSIDVLGNNPAKWKSKAVLQKDLNGNIIKEWESAWEVQRQLGINQVNISRCCRRQKKSGIFGGFIWGFKGGD